MARPGKNARDFNRCPPGFVIGRPNGAGNGATQYVRINDISAGPTGAFVAPGGGGGTSLTAIADGSILSNLSGGSAVPIEHTITATLDYVFGSTRGMFLVRGAATWGVLAVGSAGKVLIGGTDPSWSFTTSITGVGTIATGVWNGTKIGLAYGGTNADLSATGGTSQVLMQESIGAAVTVRQLTYTDISGTVPASPDWDDPFLGAWSGGGWGTGPWGGLYSGIIPPSTALQVWTSRGEGITPEWATIGAFGCRVNSSPGDPAGTTSATGVMMGLAIAFTPTKTGNVMLTLQGTGTNNTINQAFTATLVGGTGTAPTNGAAPTGTDLSFQTGSFGTASTFEPFTLTYYFAGLTPGTAYWLDVKLKTTFGAGTAAISGIYAQIIEV